MVCVCCGEGMLGVMHVHVNVDLCYLLRQQLEEETALQRQVIHLEKLRAHKVLGQDMHYTVHYCPLLFIDSNRVHLVVPSSTHLMLLCVCALLHGYTVSLSAAGARGAALIPSKGVGRTGGGEEETRVSHCRDSGGEGECSTGTACGW